MAMPKPNENKRIRSNEKLSPTELIDFMNLHGLSVREFSEILGVTEQAVKLWKTGQRDFSVTNTRLVRLFQQYPKLLKEF